MTRLLIHGGTVVTATGSSRADVAIDGGRITAVEPDLHELIAGADDVVDAHGLLVLPGAVDVHTHTRVATSAEPDRFFQDSVAAAFGGTTTFLAFNNPGTGCSPAAERSLVAGLKEWRAATESDSAIDYGVSLAISGRMDDPIGELPTVVDAGVATCKAFMVFDFRLDAERLFEAMRVMGERGGMLQVHCEDPVLIDSGVASALQHGDMAPRYHAATRPSYAEGVATARVMAFARATGAPVHVVHLSSFDALRHVREAKTLGLPVSAETCPHYLALSEARYGAADDLEVAKVVISPPLRSTQDQAAMWTGLADGSLDLIATDHVPDRAAVEKADCTRGVPFNEISNGAPGIETLLAIGYSEGVAKRRLTIERLVDLIATTPARRFGLTRKGALEPGFDADVVLYDPKPRRTLTASDLHHTSDYTPYEGFEITGAVRSVFVRGTPVVRDGTFVGTRGFGQFVERSGPAA
ncbi:MAG TPA: dihydropyrimidinase [Candidatus Polarisedimenticolia bacterium]|nr:dihydropyrimidinase [Candidatus Polarisedimenticolia bacterium]